MHLMSASWFVSELSCHRVGVRSISVHDTFGTKGGRFQYMSISVQTRSRSVHGNSAYTTSVHRQYNFGTQSVQQEYNFGTRLRNKDADCHSGCRSKRWLTIVCLQKRTATIKNTTSPIYDTTQLVVSQF